MFNVKWDYPIKKPYTTLIINAVIGYPVTRNRSEFFRKPSTNWQRG